jgi:hypothetical protein
MTDAPAQSETLTLGGRLRIAANGIRRTLRTPRAAAHLLAALIVLYGALLRLDAFVEKYGPLDQPAWARIVTRDVAPLAARLRPGSVRWRPDAKPFVGGDPIMYLQFAREMKGFYQGHVREPVFLAMVRGGLWTLDDQDVGISLASAAGSILAIVATYLLGTVLLSPIVGLLGALLVAIEYEIIAWAPEGWRDDTFMATVILSAWALLRLRERCGVRQAVLAGAIMGIACLTRITALSFIVPGAFWMVLDASRPQRREIVKPVAIALVTCAVIVAPYLIRCAVEMGDPLIAINYHTSYYRHAEGRPIDQPMKVSEYLRRRVSERPIGTLDVALDGLFVQPFINKWRRFDVWISGLGKWLQWLALVGLAVLPFFARGRLFLVILLTSLVPYVFTWNLGGGGEWRFTMHVYPFFIVAAAFAVVGGVRAAREVTRNPRALSWPVFLSFTWRGGLVAGAALAGIVAYQRLPGLVTREAIAHGDSTSLETGPRDRAFYRAGWSPPHREGVTVRVSLRERSIVHVPLTDQRDYTIVLRIDPVAQGTQDRVNVLFNRHFIAALKLTVNPDRVGSYRIPIQAQMVRRGDNELTIIPNALVTAGSAGPRFAWLPADEKIGIRLWYVRVLPGGE